jgi:beta-galactosidase
MKTAPSIFPAMLALFVALLSNNSPAADLSRQSAAAADARLTENFDSNWLFLKADAPGTEQSNFNDTGWRKLDLPHDWSIEGPFSETNKTGGAGAFLPSGVAWYRKTFFLPKEFENRRLFIEFDGVMQNGDVWINGFHLGHRPFGYVSFSYELTGHLNFGGDNVLAVRTDTSQQPASRWYSGAGIYRHVRLVVTDPVHIEQWGVFVTTPQISETQATVRVQTSVTNESDSPRQISVMATVYGPPHSAPDGSYACSGESQLLSVPAGKSVDVSMDIKIPWRPRLWDLEHPDLHTAWVRVRTLGKTLDEETVTFGIREAKFTSDAGFMLNGKKVVLYGVCLHHDGGAFGAAVPLAIWEQRLTELRKLGVNAIRTAHDPPAPEFLDLCDRMGFLVMDELFDCWTVAKNPYDYHLFFNDWSKIDAADTVRRDRNHPSVILYSAGNEIHDTPNAALANRILTGLVEVFHTYDPSRPVTQALFRPNVSGDYTNGLADLLDVIGTNYRDNELLAAQRAKPSRKIIGTEQRHDRQTWLWLRDNPSHSGQFLWSGVDYLGESRRWPIVVAGSGLLDHTGAPKPMAFERQSWWSDKPMVFVARRTAATQTAPADPGFAPLDRRQVLFADWTPTNLQAHAENVEVYSNCKEVELFLNGKSLGAKTINADASPRNWQVPFAPGKLKAVARNNGKVVATDELRTAGSPKKIVLSTDAKKLSPGWDNVAFVRAEIVDANGFEIPRADDLISFKISGPGIIAAVDSANNSSHEPFQATERRAFQGGCVAFVKATAAPGKIVLTATGPGLSAGSIAIKAAKPLH